MLYDGLQHVVWGRNLLWFVKNYIVRPASLSLQLGNPIKTGLLCTTALHAWPSTSISFVVLKYQSNSPHISFPAAPTSLHNNGVHVFKTIMVIIRTTRIKAHKLLILSNYFNLFLERNSAFFCNKTTYWANIQCRIKEVWGQTVA
jgi:hypothetical protein